MLSIQSRVRTFLGSLKKKERLSCRGRAEPLRAPCTAGPQQMLLELIKGERPVLVNVGCVRILQAMAAMSWGSQVL